MNITKIVNNGAVSLKISGRLDTTTAPQLEAQIDECLNGCTCLILDCGGLEYISSAGLRVILKAQKAMNQRGEMRLVCVNESIMEIFDITGFTDILTIE